MHAFTRPSQQLRLKVRHALLRSLHYTSLYIRILVANKLKGARLQTVGRAIHKKLNSTPKEGTTLLKFIYGKLYNGKIAKRYGHAPTDECLLCHKHDSCTHIAGEYTDHEGLRIERHNAACQLIHAAIRKTSIGGGALHSAHDLVLISAGTGTLPQTTADNLAALSSQLGSPISPHGLEHTPSETISHSNWLDPIPSPNTIRHTRHTDVSQDPRYSLGCFSAAEGDAKCTAAPCRIPEWILSHEEIQELHAVGHGTTPDLIYVRRVPDSPSPDPASFNKKLCTLIVVEIGFCRDLGCEDKIEAKTNKYIPLIAALKKHLGTVEFGAFPLGHACTTLMATLNHLTAAFSTARPRVERTRATRGNTYPVTDHTARTHDYNMLKSLLDSLTDLAQSRLLGILSNRKRLVASLPGSVSRHRVYSAANPTHTHDAAQQETSTHIHRTRETRVLKSIDMDLAHSRRTSTSTIHTKRRIFDSVEIASRHRAHSAATPSPT
jgi:hypothetical protein